MQRRQIWWWSLALVLSMPMGIVSLALLAVGYSSGPIVLAAVLSPWAIFYSVSNLLKAARTSTLDDDE